MPSIIKKALEDEGLMEDYLDRPAYQQNDYVGWITLAKMESTKRRRIGQMLSELKKGGVYMKMPHPASIKINKGL